VFPALILNYFGQGALLLSNPGVATSANFNPFYMMAPSWAVLPLVVLATAAACIASQALISGLYSLTLQAVQFGFLPRVSIRHTSAHARGQIYVPVVNWVLMLCCVGLIFGFGSASRLAAAYGIAVTLTMLVTSLQFFYVAHSNWGWSRVRVLAIVVPAVTAEVSFFSANAVTVLDGGWFPAVVAAGLFTVMTTWRTGRRLIVRDQERGAISQEDFLGSLKLSKSLVRVPGTAVFMSGTRGRTPVAMLHNLKHNKVMHERVIFTTIVTHDTPYVAREQQTELEKLDDGVFRLTGHYGFMQEPDVPQLLRRARNLHGFDCEPAEHVTFFLGRETVVPALARGMALWREHLFAFLVKVAQPPASYFKLPENRVVELGLRVRL
jgi:KUP system potassium uptake protein